MSQNHCGCIPWDFIHNIEDANECDVFGRTCFFNIYEKMIHDGTNHCRHCIEKCDSLEFKTKIVKSESLAMDLKNMALCNKYVCAAELQ